MKRRDFLKSTAVAGATAVMPLTFIEDVEAKPKPQDDLFKFRARILPINLPTANGNIYSAQAVDKMMEKMDLGHEVYGNLCMPPDAKTRLADISHVAHTFCYLHDHDTREDWVSCTIEVLDTPHGKKLKKMLFPEGGHLRTDLVFRTAMMGTAHYIVGASDGAPNGCTCPGCASAYPSIIHSDKRYTVITEATLLGVHAVMRKDASC